MKSNRSKIMAITMVMLLSICFSVTVFADSGTHTGTVTSNGKKLTHTETYTGTTKTMQARVSCPGARSAEVTMNAYYSTAAGNVYPATGNPYVSYVEPGTAAGVSYRPQSGTYCYSATATYYVDNASVWSNGFLGYR